MLVIYLCLIIFGVSSVGYVILSLIGISSEYGTPDKKPDTLYGDCPCCDSPIKINADGDSFDGTFVDYKCTNCNWHIRYEKRDKDGWRRVG